MVAFDLAVGLRMVWTGQDVAQAALLQVGLEVADDERRAPIGDDPRPGGGSKRCAAPARLSGATLASTTTTLLLNFETLNFERRTTTPESGTEYRYDGLNRRIRNYVKAASTWDVTEHYYNTSWQVPAARLVVWPNVV